MERPGDTIGPFRLHEPIGSGGFGVVWRAERLEPFRQTVAIKVIKAGMDTQAVLARFDAERRVLARMEHPGIARVLDGGTTAAGRPYFVMEFVDGVQVTRFADEAQLDLRARVALLAEAAEAVQHAHSKGVIHRDLKPSNVLVARDERGTARVKVIDFGVAKSLADDDPSRSMTEAGQLVGTPEYMSPEQADPEGLDVDTRSDVYGLGAVLYELLVGAPPFGSFGGGAGSTSTRAEVLRRIAEELPARPSRRILEAPERAVAVRGGDRAGLARSLAAELEWIPLKALRKEPDARYASAAALAADLRNWLEGRALDAGPESATYRLRALARRHRALFAAGAFAAAMLVAATGVSAYFAWSESVARAEAQARAEEARRVATFQARILDAIGPGWVGAHVMQDLVNNHASVLKATEPDAEVRRSRRERLWAEQGLVNRPDLGRTVIERWILAPTADGIDAALSDLPVAAAAMRHTIANRRLAIGDPLGARTEAERALEERRRLLGDRHHDTLESMTVLGLVLWTLGETDAALALLAECAEGRIATLGPDDPASLAARQSHANLLAQVDPARAIVELEAVTAARRALQGESHGETAGAERDLGAALVLAGRATDAEPVLRAAYSARIASSGEEAPGTIRATIDLAACLWRAGKSEEALVFARRGAELANKHFGTRDAIGLYVRGILASLLAESADASAHAEALLVASSARIAAERALGADNPTTLHCLLAEARALAARGSDAEAHAILDDAEARGARRPRPSEGLARDVAAIRRGLAARPASGEPSGRTTSDASAMDPTKVSGEVSGEVSADVPGEASDSAGPRRHADPAPPAIEGGAP